MQLQSIISSKQKPISSEQTILDKQELLETKLNKNARTIPEYLNNLSILLPILGYKSLRPPQAEAINHLFREQDLLFVVPTGCGKSLVYVATALCMHLKTIAFFPLVSLMQDQAEHLRLQGIRVGVISSAVSEREKNLAMAMWKQNELDILMIAPERLQNKDFIEEIKSCPPEFVVVDEIHCVYDHSDNFRPSYKLIAPFIKEVNPKLFLGLTATMSEEVEKSVRDVFDLHDTTKLARSYKRENLIFHSENFTPECSSESMDDYVFDEIRNCNVPVIVYCSTVKKVEQMYAKFGRFIKGGAMMYHGQLSANERESNQVNFIRGNIRVAFATNAFGMGVDKPDIGKVIFRTLPASLEELIQGFGRGGRNGCRCDCISVMDPASKNIQKMFIDIGYPSRYCIERFYQACKALADEDNIVTASLSEICGVAGITAMYSQALTQILKGYNVITRTEKTTEAKIAFKDIPPETDKFYKKFKLYTDTIEQIGIVTDSYIVFDINFLADQLDTSLSTVKKTLKAFADMGQIEYIPPMSKPPIKIIGALDSIDFSHLKEKRKQKEHKLKEVCDFCFMDDSLKADYMVEYFDRINVSPVKK